MKIAVKLAFDEQAALRLLNWLARENAILLRAQPDLPLLYDSGVTYRRETDETWCDFLNMLAQGHEDCDGLAAARAGELRARGWRRSARATRASSVARASAPVHPRRGPAHHPDRARRAGALPLRRPLPVGGRWFRDDPSARLGMNGGRIDPLVRERWAARLATGAWRTA
jgi:hypothetical protein